MQLSGQRNTEQSKLSILATIRGSTKSVLAKLSFAGANNPSHFRLSSYKPFLVPNDDGQVFDLPFDEPLARTRHYTSPWTVLPNEVADISCHSMTPAQLLDILNGIAETHYQLSPTMQKSLSKFIHSSSDVGCVYGHLRHHWHHDPSQERTVKAERADDKMRNSAIVGNTVVEVSIPPRRFWDLYANRVLPSYVLRDSRGSYRGIQPVSHSWRPPSQRHSVLTTINGKAWRVPIPRDTTLDHIRNELLILGAEYVWLDVLCLRQYDELQQKAESIRKKEWRLDIPTIGRVYEPAQSHECPVIVYFNGLGRPFRAGFVGPEDKYHWLNRVWTLQELTTEIIIGGLRHKLGAIDLSDPSSWPATVDHDLLVLLRSEPTRDTKPDLQQLCETISRRACSNPVDKVACLSYFMLKTIPIYDPDLSPDLAWDMAIENLDDVTRTEILFNGFRPRTQPDSWCPTWEEFISFKGYRCCSGYTDPGILLNFRRKSSSSIGDAGGCAYYHEAYVIRRARIQIPQPRSDGPEIGRVDVPSDDEGTAASFEIRQCGESVDQDTDYILTSFDDLEHWVVARETGVRIIDGQEVLEVAKVCTMTSDDNNLPKQDELPGGYQLVAYR